MDSITLKELLGLRPSEPAISQYIDSLVEVAEATASSPDVKSYSDVVYFNFYPLGISLLFVPMNGYKPKAGLRLDGLQQGDLILDSIDIYNVPKTDETDGGESKPLRSEFAFMTFPVSPITLPITAQLEDSDGKPPVRPPCIDVTSESTGKDLVQALAEPDRKGGGAGPLSGSINIWCEWSKDGLMVEFGGAQGKAWDTGKDAVWKVITLFRPGMKLS